MDNPRLTEYLKRKMPHATDLRVINLVRIPGGSSRETYSFDVEWIENGERHLRPMIGRRDPTGGLLKSEREREYKVVDAMYRAGMKIPEPLFLELDPAVMDRPFFIMHRMPGRTATGAAAAIEPEPLRRKLADEFMTEMARLHQLDWRALEDGVARRSERSRRAGARANQALVRPLPSGSDAGVMADHRCRVCVARNESGGRRSHHHRAWRFPRGEFSLR